ncbi:kinase-like protein [Pholiota conissans]|uniref:Kinase-like protein n=1 Tax=Pholiota conissans TaxID=109636 RepID=A0A9P5YM99_9AGAR|nr:kinase-like protein [Pholiota conissans]
MSSPARQARPPTSCTTSRRRSTPSSFALSRPSGLNSHLTLTNVTNHTRGCKATSTIKVVNRMTLLAHAEASGYGEIREEVNKFIEENLKPENLLFRTPAEEADITIADFRLSRVMEEEKHNQLTEICRTPGYMVRSSKKTGHGKPVDIWATGVITYFLLAGYTPFDRDSQQQEMNAIIAGDYKFEPAEYWANVSETAKDFVRMCLTVDPVRRSTAALALEHKWLADEQPHFVTDTTGAPADLLPNVKKAFNAKQLWRKATSTIKAVNRMTLLAHAEANGYAKIREEVNKFKEESDRENLENADITYQERHDSSHHSSMSNNNGTPPLKTMTSAPAGSALPASIAGAK